MNMCPKLNDARRKELADNVQMTNDPIWWSNTDNQSKAQQYASAHQWAARAPTDHEETVAEIRASKRNASHHGWAILAGTTRKVYFDLGGEFNLADDALFHLVKDAHNCGSSTVQLIKPATLGYPNGVPIDMAAGSTGSISIVRVTKWAVLNIEVGTLQGRRLHLPTSRGLCQSQQSTPPAGPTSVQVVRIPHD